MRRLRLRFTLAAAMAAVVLAALTMIPIVALRDRQLKRVRAEFQRARLSREVAEVALAEYKAIHEQDLKTAEHEIALAEAELKRARERLEWTRGVAGKGHIMKDHVTAAELALQKARFTLEQARTKKDVLEKYTRFKMVKELQSEVDKAKADELSKKADRDRQDAGLIPAWPVR